MDFYQSSVNCKNIQEPWEFHIHYYENTTTVSGSKYPVILNLTYTGWFCTLIAVNFIASENHKKSLVIVGILGDYCKSLTNFIANFCHAWYLWIWLQFNVIKIPCKNFNCSNRHTCTETDKLSVVYKIT